MTDDSRQPRQKTTRGGKCRICDGGLMLKHLLRGLVVLPVAGAILVAPAYAAGTAPQRQILAMDACDPVTFDQVLGAGACVRPGGLPFQQFINQLTSLQR